MMTRRSTLALAWLLPALCSASDGRLYFRNETTGQENIGALYAIPGDVITLRYSYHSDTSWGTLQFALDLTQSSIISAADAANWSTQVRAVFPATDYYTRLVYGPGVLYDSARKPGDTTQALIASNALYGLVQVSYFKALSKDVDATLFQFTVANGTETQELHWLNEERVTQNGISTRVILPGYLTEPIADNFVRVRQNHIAGRIEFSDVADTFKPPSSVIMRISPTGGTPYYQWVSLDAYGGFDLLQRAGTCKLSVKYSHWLRRTISVDNTLGDVSGAVLSLVNGDAFLDGIVDLRDINWLFLWWMSPGAPFSDLNEDGFTDLLDLSIVFMNQLLKDDD